MEGATRVGISRALSLAALGLGAVGLTGCWLHHPLLQSLLPGLVSMKANTATGLMALGLALLALPRFRWFSRSLALATCAVGTLTLGEYAFGWDLPLDQVLCDQDLAGAIGTSSPGRMAPNAALCLVLCGAAVVSLGGRRWASDALALLAGSVCLVAIVGYLYDVPALYGIASSTEMALPTAVGLMLLCGSLLLLGPPLGVMAIILGDGSGGLLARRLLPIVIVLPLMLGWLCLLGEAAGLYETSFGTSVIVVATIVFLSALVWRNALALSELDTAQARAADDTRWREHHLRAVLDSSLDGVVSMDQAGLITYWNHSAEAIFGFAASEALGRSVAELIIPERFREHHVRGLERFLTRGKGPILGRRIEVVGLRRDGSEVPLELTVSAVREGDGHSFNAFIADLTERRRATELVAASRGRAQKLLESSVIGISVIAPSGEISEANDAFLAMVGYTRADVESGLMQWDEMTPPEHRQADRRAIEEIRAGGAVAPWEKEYQRQDGSRVPVLVGVTLLDRKTGEFAAFSVDMTAQRQAERAVLLSEERYRSFFEEDLAGAAMVKPDGTIVDCNPAFLRIFGFDSVEEARQTNSQVLHPDSQVHAQLLARLETERVVPGVELQMQTRDQAAVHVVANLVGARDEHGDLVEIMGYFLDITEHKRIESQFREAQKMEAIGRLAGGVAHDFNNLLGVISGQAETLLSRETLEPIVREHLIEVGNAAERAAALTRQLLAFSRQQVLAPKRIDLGALVAEMESLLGRLIGKDIELVALRPTGTTTVEADPTQMNQIIMNLAVNARDAMPRGGKLTLETTTVELDEPAAQSIGRIAAGSYVLLAVSDTGIGMDAETRERAFEPFFTTKERGKGTGLGLATVHGIVEQSGGTIALHSAPERGTRFEIYLPRVAGPPSAAGKPPVVPDEARVGGRETVLVVEDEGALRRILVGYLGRLGYHVLEASQGAEALEVCAGHQGPIDVMVTDTVMPVMGGRELAAKVSLVRPAMRTLFMSGYADDSDTRSGDPRPSLHFLQKPFGLKVLARAVRDLLDAEDARQDPEAG